MQETTESALQPLNRLVGSGFRIYEAITDAEAARLWRNAPGFSQRFADSFADGRDIVVGQWELDLVVCSLAQQ